MDGLHAPVRGGHWKRCGTQAYITHYFLLLLITIDQIKPGDLERSDYDY